MLTPRKRTPHKRAPRPRVDQIHVTHLEYLLLTPLSGRDQLLKYLTRSELRALRLVNTRLNALIKQSYWSWLFRDIRLRIAPSSFTATRLAALTRVVSHGWRDPPDRLVITLPHSSHTHLDAVSGPYVAWLTPRETVQVPFYPNWPQKKTALRRPSRPSPGQLYELVHQPRNLAAVLTDLAPSLQILVLRHRLLPTSTELRMSCVDELIVSLRFCLDRICELGGLIALHRLDFDGNACVLPTLAEGMNWDGRGIETGWWERLTRMDMTVSTAGLDAWAVGTAERAWARVLASVAPNLTTLTLEIRHDGEVISVARSQGRDQTFDVNGRPVLAGHCPLTADAAGAELPVFPNLTELRLRNMVVKWAGEGGFGRFARERARNLVQMKFRGISWVEGHQAWAAFYECWVMEYVERTKRPSDDVYVTRKGTEYLEEEILPRYQRGARRMVF